MTTLHTEVLKPCEQYDLITPEGKIVATEKSAVMAWQRIQGTYKTTLEGLLGYEQQGWRVVLRTPQPDAAAIRVDPTTSMQDWQDKYLPQTAAQERMESDPAKEIANRALKVFHVGTPQSMPMDAAMSMLKHGLSGARNSLSTTPAEPVITVPDGYVPIPVEPTEDMLIAGMEADCAGRPSVDDDKHVRSIYKAMLAAAPIQSKDE